jgi:predicted PurR-regulated permease PerM
MFADYVLNPYLMSSGIELHPLLVLLAVLAGETLAGVPGMFFSIPVIAILRVIYLNLRRLYTQRRLLPDQKSDVRMASPGDVPGGLMVPQQREGS